MKMKFMKMKLVTTNEKPIKELVDEKEEAIREKVRLSLKKKVEMKTKDFDESDDFTRILETELIDELEDLIQEKLSAKTELKISQEATTDVYEE